MQTYQAPYVKTSYNLTKHMGRYYELAFRDLYPAPPLCDCQHTEKRASTLTDYTEEFDCQCGPGDKAMISNLLTLNATSAVTTAAEARRVGFTNVRYPSSPGMQSWADEVAAFWAV